ncbi:hypothetical protein CHLRE_03g176930v5 [Chlamydomonas reinhardtii]|uniref:HVA22-like protein n=1 Tax=Chlamydomonas reinhardtii TaxID=3055 RepID=A0A2K3DXH2_CHLRE|nr:uncharacterized protein CHLRE_03g176930v5 [Chlamydomonas reinhardtii]PNW85227.1 hypothetical protein CHLRE_03g176930v5 [Chlamydomonas reinhardtii]
MSVLEGVAHAVVQWVPLYFELKLVFVLWMTLPQTQGARMIYEGILAPRLAAWERRLRGGSAGNGRGAAAAAKAGSERDEPAGAIAAAILQNDEDRGEGGSSKVKASLRNLFHRTHKSEGAEEAGGVRGSSGGGGGGGGGTAVGEGQEVGGVGGGGGVRLYSPLSAHLQQS